MAKDAMLLDAAEFEVFVAARRDSDAAFGTGTAQDPYRGATRSSSPIPITLARGSMPQQDREAIVNSGAIPHGFQDGDVLLISGVTGDDADLWNGVFGIADLRLGTREDFRLNPGGRLLAPA